MCRFLKVKDIFYVIPFYINGDSNVEYERDQNELWNLLLMYGDKENLIVLGTLYWSRIIGNLQNLSMLSELNLNSSMQTVLRRNSNDETLNSRDRKILQLCDTFNLIIMNRRALGDEWGDYAFMNTRGRSVNKFCFISFD